MVSGVVLDQEHLLSAIPLRQAIQKGGVALAFKHLPKSVIEFRAVQIHRPENLAGVPLPRRRNQWLRVPATPRLVKTGILAKTGFIGKEQGPLALGGFF